MWKDRPLDGILHKVINTKFNFATLLFVAAVAKEAFFLLVIRKLVYQLTDTFSAHNSMAADWFGPWGLASVFSLFKNFLSIYNFDQTQISVCRQIKRSVWQHCAVLSGTASFTWPDQYGNATIMCRYSDRVKAETERFNKLDLDDLEVFSLSFSQ